MKPSPYLKLCILVFFALASTVGVSFAMNMQDGQMASCPFMGKYGSICQMSVPEHIGQWQQAFVALPASSVLLAVVLLLALFVILVQNLPLMLIKKPVQPAMRLIAIRKGELKLFDPLHLALSDGILNPELYDSRVS